MLKVLCIGVLSIVLSSGCLATALMVPAGTALTVGEAKSLMTAKERVEEVTEVIEEVVETVGFVAKHTNDVLVPGGVGTLILGGLGIWYRKRKSKNG
jgi:hypothetical protein